VLTYTDEILITFDMATSGEIPFSTFDGTLKFHRPEHLTALTAAVFQFACPGFMTKPDLETAFPESAALYPRPDAHVEAVHKMVLETAKKRGFETIELDVEPRKRRFAGDMTLGRGCYYSVCRDDSGNDDGAMANEMMAYRIPEVTGYVWIWDLRGPGIAQGLKLPASQSLIFRVDQPSLFLSRFPSSGFTCKPGAALIEVPYAIQKRRIDRCIDLRLPKSREWFFQFFRNGDGLIYRKPRGSNVSNFYEMLPALMHINAGGHTETQGVGLWMRRSGVNALIFPSARCNVGVVTDGSSILNHYGWNLVDYRGASTPLSNVFVDISPWFAEVFQPIQLRLPAGSSPPGTFVMANVEEFHRTLFRKRLEDFKVSVPKV
jgi:hypothetical protein